jgi:hypothetical protein
MLGVTRVVLELVNLRHCHDRLPDNTIQAGNLSRIVEVSLFKKEHSLIDGPGRREAAGSNKCAPGAHLIGLRVQQALEASALTV